MAKSKPTKMLAVLGRCRRGGRWQPAARSSVLAVLGDCYLDMTKALVDEAEPVKFQVTVCLGSVTFIVPPGVEIRPSGMSILASSRVAVPTAEDSSFPLIEVEWTCILGRIRVISSDSLGDGADAIIGGNVVDSNAIDGNAIDSSAIGAPAMVGAQAGAVPMEQMATIGAPAAVAPAAVAAQAPAATAAPGFGFENLGTDSPYAAAPEIPTLTEAMTSVGQAEAPAIPAVEPEPAPTAFLDFSATGDDEDEDLDDDLDDEDDSALLGGESDGSGSDGAAAPSAKSSEPSGPPSQEEGFVDLLAA